MAKVIFEFDSGEEQELIQIHHDAVSVQAAIQEFDNWLRGVIKYEECKTIDPQVVRDRLYQEFNSRGVSIWS
jgi:hypothetical protein